MSRRRNLLRLAEGLFPLSPRAALGLVARAAPRLHLPSGERPDAHVLDRALIEDLIGPVSADEMERLLRRSVAARYRGIVLRRAIERRGLGAAAGLVRWTAGSRERLESLKAEGRGACLTTWHAGPTLGIWAGIAEFGLPLLKFQVGERFTPPPDWEFTDPDREGRFRAAAMKRALGRLRGGGFVAIPADMYQWSSRVAHAECLGRSVAFSRAIPALAELSGSPVVPLFSWWSAEGQRIEVDVQAPLAAGGVESADAGAWEAALISDLAGRVEAYLRAHVDEYDAHYARMMAAHERIAGS